MQDSLNVPNGILVLCPLGNYSIDPFASHIAVSTPLHCSSVFTRVNSVVTRTQISGCLFLKLVVSIFLFYSPMFRGEFHFIQDVGDELVLFNHPVFLTCPACGHHVPHIPSTGLFSSNVKHWFLRQRPHSLVGCCSDGFKRARASEASQHAIEKPTQKRPRSETRDPCHARWCP